MNKSRKGLVRCGLQRWKGNGPWLCSAGRFNGLLWSRRLLILFSVALPDSVVVFRNLFNSAVRQGAILKPFRDNGLSIRDCEFVPLFDQKPIRLIWTSIEGVHANQRPSPI